MKSFFDTVRVYDHTGSYPIEITEQAYEMGDAIDLESLTVIDTDHELFDTSDNPLVSISRLSKYYDKAIYGIYVDNGYNRTFKRKSEV